MDDVMLATLTDDTSAGFASRRLTAPALAEADLVLTAEAAHRSLILDELPKHVRKVCTVDIAGPYRRGDAAAAAAADTMSRMLGVIVPRLAAGGSGG